MIDQATKPESNRYCSVLCLAAGKSGERLAVAKLKSEDLETRRMWSGYLSSFAILDESVEPIAKRFESDEDITVKANLLRAMGLLNDASASKILREQAQGATNDELQAAAMFGCVESEGFAAIRFLEGIKPIGPKAQNEKADGLKYLKEETSAESPNGFDVGNDHEFVARFGDLRRSPVIAWLDKKGLLEDDILEHPKKLDAKDKDELLKLLIDSKGFGLEAVKGALFLSVTPADVDQLVAIRAAVWYSPNTFSNSRTKTIAILIRHARRKS